MKKARYTDKFKAEPIKQITDRGHGLVDISKRPGVTDQSLYLWLKQNREQVLPQSRDIVSLKHAFEQSLGIYGGPRI